MHTELKKDDASLQKKSSDRYRERSFNVDQNSDLLSGESTEGFTSSLGHALPPTGQGQLPMQFEGFAETLEPTKISGPLIQRRENKTGLPDRLKNGIENLSGYAMDDVRVHYNSSKPAQLRAHAYTQGTAIHVAPGQEQYLPHEAWHVVQQKQGRVKPTLQMKGKVNVNDDGGLEREADVMGAKALQIPSTPGQRPVAEGGARQAPRPAAPNQGTIQKQPWWWPFPRRRRRQASITRPGPPPNAYAPTNNRNLPLFNELKGLVGGVLQGEYRVPRNLQRDYIYKIRRGRLVHASNNVALDTTLAGDPGDEVLLNLISLQIDKGLITHQEAERLGYSKELAVDENASDYSDMGAAVLEEDVRRRLVRKANELGGQCIWVMSEYGEIYATTQDEQIGKGIFNFHHSSFLRGKDVACGGEMGVVQGTIKWIDNQSGHYKPGIAYLWQALNEFQRKGVNLSMVKIAPVGFEGKFENAQSFVSVMDIVMDAIHYDFSEGLAENQLRALEKTRWDWGALGIGYRKFNYHAEYPELAELV